MTIRRVLLAALLIAHTASAYALDIILTNDDGFETANIRALHERLTAAGHNVRIAAPTQNNSGRGGFVEFLRPLTPLARASRYGAASVGAPGVGADPSNAQVFYVDSTPVAALLYGLDVVAQKAFGHQPDLVISGPNEGNNTGMVNISSGTVANALYAINRGIPAIAVSDNRTGSRAHTALQPGDIEFEVADIVVGLVQRLERAKRGHRDTPLLPQGLGLNVNIPAFAVGTGRTLRMAPSRMGVATAFAPVFFERLSDSAVARGVGLNLPLPGVSIVGRGETPPAGVELPQDTRRSSEQNVIERGLISITVIQGVPQAERVLESLLGGEREHR